MTLVVFLSLLFGLFNAQQEGAIATFAVDKTTPLTGEAVQFTLILEMPADYILIEWPQIPIIWGDFDVSDITPMKNETLASSHVRYTQTFTARLWRPGDFETPATFIAYQRPGEDGTLRIPVRTTFFSVPTVLDRDDLTLRPYLPPKAVLFVPIWLIFALSAVVVGGGAAGWRWWSIRRTHQDDEGPIVVSPAQQADSLLSNLDPNKAIAYEIAVTTSETLIRFIAARYGVDVIGLTTTEVMQILITHETCERIERMERMLNRLDLIKFTGIDANTDELERLINSARRWVADVDLDAHKTTEPAG